MKLLTLCGLVELLGATRTVLLACTKEEMMLVAFRESDLFFGVTADLGIKNSSFLVYTLGGLVFLAGLVLFGGLISLAVFVSVP